MTGGTLLPRAGFANAGEIRLEGHAATIGSGTLNNAGLLSGTGRVDAGLVNEAAGEVRASGAERLVFTDRRNRNAGRFTLLNGGTIEFTQDLENEGRVSGHGTLIARGGLANVPPREPLAGGQITFTAGLSHLFGPLTNRNGAKVTVTGGGTATFHDPATLEVGSTFQVSAGSRASFLAPVTAGRDVFTGAGTRDFEAGTSNLAGLTAAGTTVVREGAAIQAGYLRENRLEVEGTVRINARAAGGQTSAVRSLLLAGSANAWTGKMDLADTALVLDYDPAAGESSPLATVANQVKAGHAGGAWGGNGITSASAAADATRRTGLGYAEAAQVLGAAGGTFQGHPSDNSAVLVGYTLYGDANLDGFVDGGDFARLAGSFGKTSQSWLGGDFNYDARVDGSDFALLASNFGRRMPAGAAAALSAGDWQALEAFGTSIGVPVPEPTAAALLAGAAAAVLARPRRVRNAASAWTR
jgi:hypothetical protein